MALHIADEEVARLVSDLANLEAATKTEALRRVLRDAVKQRRAAAKRKDFREFALRIAADARSKGVRPVTKEQMDELWGMEPESDGD